MIASPLTGRPARYDYEEPPGRPGGTRAGRTAVQRRRARTRRNRYAALTRILLATAGLVLIVTIYLALMANVTRMGYELTALERQRAALAAQTELYDDAIASAASGERLEAFAKRLHMHEPQSFTAIALPPNEAPFNEAPQPAPFNEAPPPAPFNEAPPPAPRGLAFLGSLK